MKRWWSIGDGTATLWEECPEGGHREIIKRKINKPLETIALALGIDHTCSRLFGPNGKNWSNARDLGTALELFYAVGGAR